MVIPSVRAPFNDVVRIYLPAAPGVPGTFVSDSPCRVVSAAHIVDFLWAGALQYTYFTTESADVLPPDYPVTAGSFSQVADFSAASIVDFASAPGVYFLVVHKQVLFWTTYSYVRFTLAEASLFVGVEDPCEMPTDLDLSVEYDFCTDYPEELWFSIPVGASRIQLEGISRSGDDVDYHLTFLGGTCADPSVLGGSDFIFGEPETIILPDGTFRVLGSFMDGVDGQTFCGFVKFLPP